MNYRTLMTSKEIPWHNPKHVPISSVPDGWRFATADESARPPLDALVWFGDMFGGRLAGPGDPLIHRDTYITREPLPEKYRHLVEPEIPAGLPPLPEPPAGHRWVYRGKGWNPQCKKSYACADFHWVEWNSFALREPDGSSSLHYIDAVKIEQPAKDDPDSDSHKLAVLLASLNGVKTQYFRKLANVWADETVEHGCQSSIERGYPVRIKPTPVKVPLSDYRVSELIRKNGVYYVIRDFKNGNLKLTSIPDGFEYECAGSKLFVEGGEIHRNGTWQDCLTLAD